MWYKAEKVQKYALNSQLQALQILTNDDEFENWSLSSFLLAVIGGDFAKFCGLLRIYELYYIVVHNFGGATEANEKKRGRENPSGGNYVQISSKA